MAMFAVKKYVIGAYSILLVVLGVYGYGQYKFKSGRTAAKLEQYVADLEQFKKQVGELHAVSLAIYQASNQLQSVMTANLKEYQHEAIINPLPAGCVMSDGRVRSINDIISEAAAARQSSHSMPTSGSVK